MTQIHRPDGRVVPATVISAAPCVVTALRTAESDGYVAVQIGTGVRRKITKSLAGHLKTLGKLRHIKEFRPKAGGSMPELKVGDKLDLSQFIIGDKVGVVGTSKGRGFQGVVKRHHFHGSPKTHGHKDQLRMPGSIGATEPQHVFKGTRMGGRMGSDRVSVKNLEVVAINAKKQEIVVKGAVPGARNSLLLIQSN